MTSTEKSVKPALLQVYMTRLTILNSRSRSHWMMIRFDSPVFLRVSHSYTPPTSRSGDAANDALAASFLPSATTASRVISTIRLGLGCCLEDDRGRVRSDDGVTSVP